MARRLSWKECIEENAITRSEPDPERSFHLLKMAQIRHEFWSQNVEDKFTSLKVEAFYDIIKELIVSHMYKMGFNCPNHLCLIAYIQEKFENFEFEISKIDELRQLRNEISYRGFTVKKDYLKRNESEFNAIIRRLKKEIES